MVLLLDKTIIPPASMTKHKYTSHSGWDLEIKGKEWGANPCIMLVNHHPGRYLKVVLKRALVFLPFVPAQLGHGCSSGILAPPNESHDLAVSG